MVKISKEEDLMSKKVLILCSLLLVGLLVTGCAPIETGKAEVEGPVVKAPSTPSASPASPEKTSSTSSVKRATSDEKMLELAEKVQDIWDEGVLVVATFNSGDKPNLLGGDFGSWTFNPQDKNAGCKISFNDGDYVEAFEDDEENYSLYIEYDVDSPNEAFNGLWLKFNDIESLDVTGYKYLCFWLKGDSIAGYPKRFKMELKDETVGYMGAKYYLKPTEEWQKIVIPLIKFKKIQEWDALTEFVFVFEDKFTIPKVGAVYLDNIYFANEK